MDQQQLHMQHMALSYVVMEIKKNVENINPVSTQLQLTKFSILSERVVSEPFFMDM